MGRIIRYTHKECGFELEFFEGVGFKTFAMQCESGKYMREGKWGEHWRCLIEKYPEGTVTLNKALCYCEKCKKYFSEPRIEFYIHKDEYRYTFCEGKEDSPPPYINREHYQLFEKEIIICPDCDDAVLIMEKFSQIPCPVCGKMRKGRHIGYWD